MSTSFGISPVSGSGRSITGYGSSHLLVLGVIDLLCGVIALVWPGVTVLVLALIFGVLLLMAGLLVLAVGSTVRRAGGRPVLTFVVGGFAILAGLICILHPGAGVWAIVLGCALWFLMTGVGDLVVAFASPANRVWFGLLGVLSLLAALILLVHPGVAIVTVAVVAGISFLVRGAGELALGSRLRRSVRR